MSKILIWIGNFESEQDFENYMNQSAFREWWADYDHGSFI